MKLKSLILIFIYMNTAIANEKNNLPVAIDVELNKLTRDFSANLLSAILTHDRDNDGRVQLRSVLVDLMKRGFARPGGPVPEMYKKRGHSERYRRSHADADKDFIKRIPKDEAGMIGESEISVAIKKAFDKPIERMLSLDVDGDGKINLKEYAVGSPITPEHKVDKEGFTEIQRKGFKRHDLDENGFLEGHEWLINYTPHIQNWIDAVSLTIVIHQADKDGDSILSHSELKSILPKAKSLPENVPMNESRYWVRELSKENRKALVKVFLPKKSNIASTSQWSKSKAAYNGQEIAIWYRGAVFGKTLVIEANHGKGWHSYSMDNTIRAQAKNGPDAMSELPTRLRLEDSVKTAGDWRQTKPKDMSKPKMNWNTWGFEGKTYFIRELSELPKNDFSITINAQVCNEGSCAMANDLVLKIPSKVNNETSPASVENTIAIMQAK